MTVLEWFKSSYSSNEGPDCVEVAIATPDATVHVRDSKNTHGDRLTFTGPAWNDFLAYATR
ncbi:DUF397 domain-containing protein [Streptomyces sp. MMBL 11-3]|uniref:DUF397 domain-containing protein n=1 Tax=Streptomyces sp. MMBL 11-3 TaxID=3382639 RepID=UPI0039B3DA29